MKKVLKWLGFVVAGVVVVALLGSLYVYFASERALDRQYEIVAEHLAPLSVDPAARAIEVAEGARLARVVGCTHCHGETLTGLPIDIPPLARFVAPNITTIVPQYDDAQLATLIRRGIRRDGKATVFMPSEMMVHLSDADLARVIAWVRTVPKSDGIHEKTEVHPIGRLVVALGQFQNGADAAAPFKSADIDVDPADPVSRGRYFVMNACTECHGQNLEGREVAHSPPLTIAKSYSLADFEHLMHDGIALGNRKTELMTPTAVARFSAFTPDEVSDIYAFLQSRS